ncbi:patatin-like phospholipase family protein [Cellulophaga sp. E16_2]|uniref:patatin-like phospholipase family protein n=1 Tax=Cellulophaga sp. E16_2 TaxID=2789297 RepID=UPI001A931C6E|nr:patatin-like phospholipase family protein [Cellulophaga sp. E16_2]MBO0590927.1 patatin-like phospholipase family protein [Cellulophaga sp. E16_2]
MNRILFLLAFLVSIFTGVSQDNSKKEDIKVGLVLSGGGAKGFAHIGALKVIEEAGVQIDYIGGTSMGAIVGALYASGYSANELDSIFRNTDFTKLIQDNLPRSSKTFYEKEDSERYALTLPFKNFKISFPSAISSGQSIYNELVQLLYHVDDIEDFSKLPIPFFCVATDVETGNEIMLNKGYLPEAILASGTFPSLFEPTEIDGKVLIDGGVINNYPIDGVLKMGADVIIGVDVQHGLSSREHLGSATEVLLQINNYRTVKDMVKKVKETDIYIKPNIEKYSVIDFAYLPEIINSGELAARENYIALKELAIKQNRKPYDKTPVIVKDTLVLNNLIINGSDNYSRGFVKGKLRFPLDNNVTFEKLQQGIGNLSATGNFKTIRYHLEPNNDKTDLVLDLRENKIKTFIKMGVHYDDLFNSAAILNLTKKNILFDDDVVSFDFILGDNVRYNLDYYIDKGSYWSFGFNSRFVGFGQDIDYQSFESNFNVPADSNVKTINIDVSDVTNQLYLQTVVKEEFAFTLGVEHKFLKYSTETISQLSDSDEVLNDNRLYFEKSNFFSGYGKLTLDTYDSKYFPSKGLFFEGDFHFYVASSDFTNNFKEFSVAQSKMGAAFPLFDKVSLNIETEGGFKLGTSSVSTFDFILGGFGAARVNNFISFYGYDFLSLPGNSFVKGLLKLDYEFAAKNHLMFVANYANVDDDLFRTGEWFKEPTFSGYGVGYGWESFIGPLQVIYSWTPEKSQSNLFFSVGYWF